MTFGPKFTDEVKKVWPKDTPVEWKEYKGTTHGFAARPNLGIETVVKAFEVRRFVRAQGVDFDDIGPVECQRQDGCSLQEVLVRTAPCNDSMLDVHITKTSQEYETRDFRRSARPDLIIDGRLEERSPERPAAGGILSLGRLSSACFGDAGLALVVPRCLSRFPLPLRALDLRRV